MLATIVEMYGERNMLGHREVEEVSADGRKKRFSDDYTWFTYDQVGHRVLSLAAGLKSLGVQPRHRVVIFMETRLEWTLSAHAILQCGATVATLYATLGDDGIVHALNELEAEVIITSDTLCAKLEVILKQCNQVKHVIAVRQAIGGNFETITAKIDGLVPFDVLEQRGELLAEEKLTTANFEPDDVALIMYTSGSTGTPKGVMVTHDNVINYIAAMTQYMEDIPLDDQAKYVVSVTEFQKLIQPSYDLIVLSL